VNGSGVTERTPWLVDAHLDLAWNALQWNRDLRMPTHVLRVREATKSGPGRGRGTVALPEMQEARIGLAFATLLARSSGTPREHVDFDSREQAHAVAQGQFAYYEALDRVGALRLLRSSAEWAAHHAELERLQRMDATLPLGVIISMEGADPILDPETLPTWVVRGLRMLGLAHYGPSHYAGGTGTDLGVSDAGFALLGAMEGVGVALDLTHLSDRAFWQAIRAFDGPVHVSHGNARALVANQRQLSDDQIRAVAERGGVIGIALDNWMLTPGWVKGVSRRVGVVGLRHVVEHVVYLRDLLGGVDAIGIGTDLDGGFGTEQAPEDLDTIADLRKLNHLLAERDFSLAEREAIFHGSWVAWLRGWF